MLDRPATRFTPAQLQERLSGLHPELFVLGPVALDGRHPGEHPDNFAGGVMAQPASSAAAAALVTWCAAHDVAIVPQGGLTGLVGGNVSHQGEVILSSARLNRILAIHPNEMTVEVEAGVPLEACSRRSPPTGSPPASTSDRAARQPSAAWSRPMPAAFSPSATA